MKAASPFPRALFPAMALVTAGLSAHAYDFDSDAGGGSALDQLGNLSGGGAPSVPQPGAPERVSPQQTRTQAQSRPSPQVQMAQTMLDGIVQGLLRSQSKARAAEQQAELERQKAAAAAAKAEIERKKAFAMRQFKLWETQAADSHFKLRGALGEPGAAPDPGNESIDDILAGPGDPDEPGDEPDNADNWDIAHILTPRTAVPPRANPDVPAPANRVPGAPQGAAQVPPPPGPDVGLLAVKAAAASTEALIARMLPGPGMAMFSIGRVAVTTAARESLLNALVKMHNAPGTIVGGAGATPWGREDAVEFLENMKRGEKLGVRAVCEWIGF